MVSAYGMDLDTFTSFLNQSTGRSYVSETWPLPPKRIELPAMPVKDMTRCLQAAADIGAWMPMTERMLAVGTGEEARPDAG